MLARIAALVAHEAHARLVVPVLAEYRKLDAPPPACDRDHFADRPPYDPTSTTGAQVERADGWDHDKRAPVVAACTPFGFGPFGSGGSTP